MLRGLQFASLEQGSHRSSGMRPNYGSVSILAARGTGIRILLHVSQTKVDAECDNAAVDKSACCRRIGRKVCRNPTQKDSNDKSMAPKALDCSLHGDEEDVVRCRRLRAGINQGFGKLNSHVKRTSFGVEELATSSK